MRWLVVILAALLLLMQYRLWFGEGSLAQKTELERQVREQIERNGQLRERNRVLMEDVASLKSGLDAIEERARADLGMIKKDETFFLVVDSRVKKLELAPSPQARAAMEESRDTSREDEAADSIPTDVENLPESPHQEFPE